MAFVAMTRDCDRALGLIDEALAVESESREDETRLRFAKRTRLDSHAAR